LPNQDTFTFVGEDEIKVTTPYADFDMHLDSATGVPIDKFPVNCAR